LEEVKTSAIGIMSGTSLDGLDLCYVNFSFHDKWHFEIVATEFIPYDEKWRLSLANAHSSEKTQLDSLHQNFGAFTSTCVNHFLQTNNLEKPDIVCSHGHTVFHDPANGITLQVGDGEIIARKTGITCVSDFRTEDVSLGGQGAPLVPIGDELLFSDYEACLNLGGFSNISFRESEERRAFDICPVNIILNPLANLLGKDFDKGGEIARNGNIDLHLFSKLNDLPLYSTSTRPSLAREWIEQSFMPLVEKSGASTEDKIATLTEHAAQQIASVINQRAKRGKVLTTGGGAKNKFLIERLIVLSEAEIIVPKDEIVDFKEALIFGFLGVLKVQNQTNVLRSVTGSSRDSNSGTINIVF
jgi:anhydro-N-acetylmuramic acid kinase